MTASESPEIQRLDERTVERIAAGEVVERPASAVKELLENSIDADASRVSVAVEAGGTDSIVVSDDGIGMDEQTVRRAVEKHTTSKITTIDDLEGGVETLGFRGEALHAIGAVSRLTITTRPRSGDRGTELTVEGGEVTDVSPAGCPEGTTVEVADLFYNVPARRKYLKQDSTEFAHVNTVVTSYALANPDVAVTLEHNGRETFATTGTGDLKETVLSVYGREVAESMLELDVSAENLPDGPLDGISGLVSHPETNRASRDYLSTYVNGRYVTANTVRDAVVDAYDGQLGPDRYPFAVVFLELDPATVDVNVHPRKLEVRFADDEGVTEQVQSAVRETLLDAGLLRTSAPRGRSAPEQTDIRPEGESTGTETASSERSPGEKATADTGSDPVGTVRRRSDQKGDVGEADSSAGEGHSTEENQSPTTSQSAEESTESQNPASPEPLHPDSPEPQQRDSVVGSDRESADDQSHNPRQKETSKERRFRRRGKQSRLAEEEGTALAVSPSEETFDQLPPMRILGQFQETYVVAETDDGLVLIDQHAADERINYERLRESFSGDTTTQALAEPVRLELTPRERELFSAHRDALARLGFHATLVEDSVVEVSTVPSLLADAGGPELVRDVLGGFVTGETAAAETVEGAADELLADLACYPSVTGNTSLKEGSVLALLESLDDCENPYACPHGRPVIIEFDLEEIEGRFERDYPGHS